MTEPWWVHILHVQQVSSNYIVPLMVSKTPECMCYFAARNFYSILFYCFVRSLRCSTDWWRSSCGSVILTALWLMRNPPWESSLSISPSFICSSPLFFPFLFSLSFYLSPYFSISSPLILCPELLISCLAVSCSCPTSAETRVCVLEVI